MVFRSRVVSSRRYLEANRALLHVTKWQTGARGLLLAGYFGSKDVVKLLLADSLAQWFLVSYLRLG
jgi:hypothetical protein